MKPIEEHLSAYLLALQRGSWTRDYNRACLMMWRKTYGEKLTDRVERIVMEKWTDKKKKRGSNER